MTSFDRNRDSVGFAPLDDDHHRLDAQLRALADAVRDGKVAQARLRLGEALEHFETHFATEERLMAESRYKDLARHKEAHDTFLADARRFAKELESKGLTPGLQRWATGRLQAWVQHHVVTNDAALGRHLYERRGGA